VRAPQREWRRQTTPLPAHPPARPNRRRPTPTSLPALPRPQRVVDFKLLPDDCEPPAAP